MRPSFFALLPIALAGPMLTIFTNPCWSDDSNTSGGVASGGGTNLSLENYSIKYLPPPPDPEGLRQAAISKKLLEGKEKATVTWYHPPLAHTAALYRLTKPDQKNLVAIVKIDPNGDFALNPDGWGEYGPIPSLQNLTLSIADQLWGHPDRNQETIHSSDPETAKTYDLLSSDLRVLKHFHLDVVFEHDLLQRYRVRCDDHTAYPIRAEWCLVHKKHDTSTSD